MRLFLLAAAMTLAAPAAAIDYPVTAKVAQTDVIHGITVADPYRWLENDVRTDKQVEAWVAAENKVTQAYLATLPRRAAIKARLTQLYDYERFMLPTERGGAVFYRRNSGLQNQFVLYVQDKGGVQRVLLDPNTWSKDGATALAEWAPSRDGRHVVYAVQDGGTDWRTVHVVGVSSGKVLDDKLDWVKFSELAWNADGSGFYYSRYPQTPGGTDFRSEVFDHAVFFHRLGTPQSEDAKVFATPENRGYYNPAVVSADGRWLVLLSSTGSDDRYEVRIKDLAQPEAPIRTLVAKRDADYRFAGSQGTTLYFVTNKDAPTYRLVAFDGAHVDAAPRTIVPAGKATITASALVGGHLLVTTLEDAKTVVRRYSTAGAAQGVVALPGIGTASGFDAEPGKSTTYFQFASYNAPTTIYRYDAATNKAAVFRRPVTKFDPAQYEVTQVFYTSKDGTRVPMFVSHKRGLDLSKGAPTLLYGYGGFNISVLPAFRVDALAWMEMGGVYASANLRGGGEYGAAWHSGGKLFNKQNVFDDCIAAAEYLVKTGVTTPAQLVVQGGSNGGTLVGAVVNQRPDLFAVGLPAVGVMDMLRFPLFTEGRTWTDDYGDPKDPAAFKNLLAYSPYHNIKGGRVYPAIMATTADTDDRVVPGHSFKYIAALQAADAGPKPHLIRIDTRAGHGSGKPTAKIIEEVADEWAFAAKWTGMPANPATTR